MIRVNAGAPARLFRGARLYTPEPAPAGHDALATVGDRIVAVGTEEQCRASLPGNHVEVDLTGCSLVPGFVDAHLHPLVMSVFERHLRFDHVRSLSDVFDAVADAARRSGADPGAVVGFQLDDQQLTERRLPTADELEAVAPGRPVVLVRRDGHHAVANATALAAVGLDHPDGVPDGGYVARDAAGRPTGLVGENAVATLLAVMPEVTMDDLSTGLVGWSQRLVRQGVTAISAICQTSPEGPSGPAGELEAVAWAELVGQVPFDVQTILITPDPATVREYQGVAALHDPGAGRRVDAVKIFLDGTLGGASACMHQPFTDRAHTAGMRTTGDDEAYRRMEAAHRAGLQICIHAIGDRANRDAADLFDRLLDAHPGPHRHRVEHASVLDETTVESFARNRITCVVQPINLRSEAHWLADRLGPDRIARAYPFRSLLQEGVPLAGSSDAPIEDTDVVAAMDAAVHRRGLADEQALTPLEALRLYTRGSSAARNTEDRLGSLTVASRADLVVLGGDLATTPLADLDVRATFIGGVEHHRSSSLPASAFRRVTAPSGIRPT